MTMALGRLLVSLFLAIGFCEASRRELGLVAGSASFLTRWKNHLCSLGLLVGQLLGHGTLHAYRG